MSALNGHPNGAQTCASSGRCQIGFKSALFDFWQMMMKLTSKSWSANPKNCRYGLGQKHKFPRSLFPRFYYQSHVFKQSIDGEKPTNFHIYSSQLQDAGSRNLYLSLYLLAEHCTRCQEMPCNLQIGHCHRANLSCCDHVQEIWRMRM